MEEILEPIDISLILDLFPAFSSGCERSTPVEARWTCQECGESFRKLVEVACQVWLADDPHKMKRVCAACHKQLTREKKIIREAK